MKSVLSILWAFAVSFYYTFFLYKLYQWYSPHVGEVSQYLPDQIAYLEMYAISTLFIIVRGTGTLLPLALLQKQLHEIHNYEPSTESKITEHLLSPIMVSMMLFFAYLIKIILY